MQGISWGFVDYENIGSLEAVDLGKYQRVFVFLGAKNKKVKVGDVSSAAFCTLEIMALKTMGANNLDFHLAFHLGRFHETANEGVEFHVITNDSGFDGLINHVKKLGRKCKRVSTNKPEQLSKPPAELSTCATLIVDRLAPMDGRTRPRKKAKLVNWIKSQCAQLLDGADPVSFYEELKQAKIIRESGSDITYEIKH